MNDDSLLSTDFLFLIKNTLNKSAFSAFAVFRLEEKVVKNNNDII